ncbi:MAG: hypothetical protein MMC23_002581 [Stictis urceolatum]|nr:hypothetical protein [Stictis urceolata]
MSLSKFLGSFFSVSNENSLALANLKFDFALVKVEAPTEYSALGPALTSSRRANAEEGGIHRTARRLGALFEQTIPSTPKLVTSYGLRCTEIIKTPGVNPEGSSFRHGPFHNFVGADGTALWAAATSGIASLGVYLLACLLADCWGPKEAISIWVELVERRKKEIRDTTGSGSLVTDSSILSAQQEITRSDLAAWDASARAWLQSADQAKYKQKSQLNLIVKNTPMPFDNGPYTYEKVIEIWTQSMIGLENLLQGKPQLVNSKSTLLSLSAWHIYPDLIVLGKDVVNVPFRDRLVPRSGVCTFGGWAPARPDKTERLLWSMTLSHLRYYGGPITVNSDGSKSRVTLPQLHLVVLGALFGIWRVRRIEIYDAAHWMADLWCHLESKIGGSCSDYLLGFNWLKLLSAAAKSLIKSQLTKKERKSDSELLVVWGGRRAKEFICRDWQSLPPWFGLRNPCVLSGLSESHDRECSVRYHRDIAAELQPGHHRLLVFSRWKEDILVVQGGESLPQPCELTEYSSAVRPEIRSRKRDRDGNLAFTGKHARYLHISIRGSPPLEARDFEQNHDLGLLVARWKKWVESRGELAFHVLHGLIAPSQTQDENLPVPLSISPDESSITWYQPPPAYSSHAHQIDILGFGAQDCMRPDLNEGPRSSVNFVPIVSHDRAGLYVDSECMPLRTTKAGPRQSAPDIAEVQRTMLDFDQVKFKLLSPIRLYDYFCCVTGDPRCNYAIYTSGLAQPHAMQQEAVASLRALDIASVIYQDLDHATVSLDITENPLHESPWFKNIAVVKYVQIGNHEAPQLIALRADMPTRAEAFACIAEFDSGDLALEPESLRAVFAVSSNNSLFVSERLLTDPYVDVPEYKMRRIVGNIGKSGVCLLVAPDEPQIRTLSKNYDVVTHAVYDELRENNFKGTSMHLEFSNWTAPLVDGVGSRTIDSGAQYVESMVRVYDEGKWVADLDIVGINFKALTRIPSTVGEHRHSLTQKAVDYTSIDSWEEFLDKPETVGIFRASNNWVARLAAVSIMSQWGQTHSVGVMGPGDYCLPCLEENFSEAILMPHESALPSICID